MAERKPQPSKATSETKPSPRRVASGPETMLKETTQLSEEILQAVADGQRAAIDAVQELVDSVDHTLPALPHGEGASRRQEVIDSALQMAGRLVHSQYEFIRKVVDDAGGSRSAGPAPGTVPRFRQSSDGLLFNASLEG